MGEADKDVRIVIERRAGSGQWGWEVTVDGQTWYGYEYDYLNAEGEMHDRLREMGVDE